MREEKNGQNDWSNLSDHPDNAYYLQDELGSPIRLLDEEGNMRETYGYDEFGQNLYRKQGQIQPFGYTGYQSDRIAGTYYAQAREYRAELGRFAGVDIIKGFAAAPYTLNEYGYCWGNPEKYVDNDGQLPTIVIGAIIGGVVSGVGSVVSQVVSGKSLDEVNWKEVGIDALSGTAAGAIAGTGVGIVGLAVGGAAVGAGNYVAKTTVNKEWKEKSVEQHLIEGSLNVVEWSLATILGGSMKESRGIINGIREEYKFASSMLGAEAARGIPAKIFYETVKKDIVNAFGKAVWETFYKSFFRTGIVGGRDTLYNTFFKDKVVEYFSEGCIKDD